MPANTTGLIFLKIKGLITEIALNHTVYDNWSQTACDIMTYLVSQSKSGTTMTGFCQRVEVKASGRVTLKAITVHISVRELDIDASNDLTASNSDLPTRRTKSTCKLIAYQTVKLT